MSVSCWTERRLPNVLASSLAADPIEVGFAWKEEAPLKTLGQQFDPKSESQSLWQPKILALETSCFSLVSYGMYHRRLRSEIGRGSVLVIRTANCQNATRNHFGFSTTEAYMPCYEHQA